eukprot:g18055.t1
MINAMTCVGFQTQKWNKNKCSRSLQEMTSFPRFPDDERGLLLSYALPKVRLCVFVSHRWVRSAQGHPDDEGNSKFSLLLKGVEWLCKAMAPTLPLENVFLWVDYCCINQDSAPASELDNLPGIVHECDVLFTPLTGESKGKVGRNPDLFMDYHNAVWRPLGDNQDGSSYVERGWCRVEMFLGSTQDLRPGAAGELKSYLKLALLAAISQDRRAHFLYSQKERDGNMPPLVLPPLQNSYFHKYNPAKGKLTKEEDRQVIQRLVDNLIPRVRVVQEGYEGQRNAAGQAHGFGKYMYHSGVVYEGEYQADLMHGKGKYIHANGDVYEGEYQAGKMHGKGKFSYADGNVYEGEYQAGLRHGKGKFSYVDGNVYEGEYQAGLKHGKGKFSNPDGAVYEGGFQAGLRHGKGKYRYPDGDVYEGEYQDDKRHGKGKFSYADGVHEGEYQAGKRHGKGKFSYVDGGVYEGEYKADLRHGTGKYTFPSGDVYEGEFQDDKRHGKGKCSYADVGVYEGEFQAGLRHGKGKLSYDDGNVYEGDFQADKMHGKGKYTFHNGTVYEGDFQAGLRHGKGKFSYDGNVYEGDFQADKIHGKGTLTNANGKLLYDGMWADGIQVGYIGATEAGVSAQLAPSSGNRISEGGLVCEHTGGNGAAYCLNAITEGTSCRSRQFPLACSPVAPLPRTDAVMGLWQEWEMGFEVAGEKSGMVVKGLPDTVYPAIDMREKGLKVKLGEIEPMMD